MKKWKMNGLLLFLLPIISIFFIFDNNIQQESEFESESEPLPLSNQIQSNNSPESSATFIESAAAKGIIFQHEANSGHVENLTDTYGSGVCILDWNNDGYEDIFIVGGQGSTRRYGKSHWWANRYGSKIYLNINGDYFQDITKQHFPNELEGGFGCAVLDLNFDGLADIAFGSKGKINLIINASDGHYQHQEIRLPAHTLPMSLTVGDWNNDQLEDILVATLVYLKNDIKVGTLQYGYLAQSPFSTQNYSGQQNIILRRMPARKEIYFEQLLLPNFDRSLSVSPLSLLNIKLKNNTANFMFNSNAVGSSSTIESTNTAAKLPNNSFFNGLKRVRTPLVQTATINVKGKPALLFTNHNIGGHQLRFTESSNHFKDMSWELGINTTLNSATNNWATLIADFNNDGSDDIFSTKGFAMPSTDSKSRPQGSKNDLLLQENNGTFSGNNSYIFPNLTNDSRGAAYADFNNDGLFDIAVNNNNGFFSLYMNHSKENNWIAINCKPMANCQNTTWAILNEGRQEIRTQEFSRPQPFLSSNQKIMHFGLPHGISKISVRIMLPDGTLKKFNNLPTKSTYDVNLKVHTIQSIEPKSKNKKTTSVTQLLTAEHPQLLKLLYNAIDFSDTQVVNIAEKAVAYKLKAIDRSAIQSPEFLTLTNWLLSQSYTMQDPKIKSQLLRSVIKLIGASENRLFTHKIINLIDTLQDENFCLLMEQLHFWFWEEEVAPQSKQLLKSPIIYRTLASPSNTMRGCGLHAISATEDTTLGNSLTGLLANDTDPTFIKAAIIRTLGFLKNRKSLPILSDFCNGEKDSIVKIECAISLFKLAGNIKRIALNNHDVILLSLHNDNIVLKRVRPRVNMPYKAKLASIRSHSISNYLFSPIPVHFELAHVVELVSAVTDIQRKESLKHLSRLRKPEEIEKIINKWQSLFPTDTDPYFKFNPPEVFINYASNTLLLKLLNSKKTYSFSYSFHLVKQCINRKDIALLCKRKLDKSLDELNGNLGEISETTASSLIYLLMSKEKIKRKIVVQKLLKLSVQEIQKSQIATNPKLNTIFKLLRINNSYLFINMSQVDDDWLNSFLHSTFNADKALNRNWLSTIESIGLDKDLIDLLAY